IAFFRELLGFGTIFGIPVLPKEFTSWTIMVMPPSAFFVLAIFIWITRGMQMKSLTTKSAEQGTIKK
ncbi:MAG: hypothetical protein ACK4MM_02075, partial [Fervidobacterium sp.]